MASARRLRQPSRRPRLRATATTKRARRSALKTADGSEKIHLELIVDAPFDTEGTATHTDRARGSISAVVALALIAVTFFLLPGPVRAPDGAPRNTTSVDQVSMVALYSAPYGGDEFNTHLTWSWQIVGGQSRAKLSATVDSRVATGNLIFGGPISELIECHLNGEPIVPSPGFPDALGFEPPQSAQVWLHGRDARTVAHISFQGDPGPGGTVIWCDVRDFQSDAPPVHRLYTPRLFAYAHGSEAATDEDFRLRRVCVDVAHYSVTESQEQCADSYSDAPMLGDREELINLPEEQGMRDSRLLLIGAVAGVAAATLLGVLTGYLTAFFHYSTRRLRALRN